MHLRYTYIDDLTIGRGVKKIWMKKSGTAFVTCLNLAQIL